jgi:hypothetical protein
MRSSQVGCCRQSGVVANRTEGISRQDAAGLRDRDDFRLLREVHLVSRTGRDGVAEVRWTGPRGVSGLIYRSAGIAVAEVSERAG